jgi:hypothetical protein
MKGVKEGLRPSFPFILPFPLGEWDTGDRAITIKQEREVNKRVSKPH